jgi:predicted peroxiredoxin
MPARRLIVVVWSCGPDRPGGAMLAAAPFVYALTARALEVEVEMHFTSSAVRWLLAGVADSAYTDQRRSKTVRDFIAEAQRAGVLLCACGMALAEHRRADERLIDGVQRAGAATVIDAALDADTRTMVF